MPRQLNTIAHNIANSETTGFKKSRVDFADIVAGSAYTNPRLIQGIGSTVEAVKVLQRQPLGVDQVPAQHVECHGEPRVDREVRAHGVVDLIGERPRLAGRGVSGQHARAIPPVAHVHVRREAVETAGPDGKRLQPWRTAPEQVHLVASGQPHVQAERDAAPGIRERRALTRLTDDHSVVFDAVRAGTLTVEQARAHPRRNLVTQAVGLAEGIDPTTTTASIALGDLLLLCSDGLWETLSEAELSSVLDGEGAPRVIAESLLARALDAGGPHNVSVVAYRHGKTW